jgi:hypothetical protein
MASLRIPEEHKQGLARLLNLGAEDWQKVLKVLATVPITNTLASTLAEELAHIDSIPPSDLEDVPETLISLYIVLAHSKQEPSEVIEDIQQALEGKAELRFPNEVGHRLSQLLDFESLVVSTKAEGLMYEYENIFSTARVVTDIRPVFGFDVEELPKAAVIIHTLSLHYYHEGNHREIRLALDEIDIDDIIEALERASKKAESLKSVLETAQLTYVEP